MKYLIIILFLLKFNNLFAEDIYRIEHAYVFGENIQGGPTSLKCFDENNCIFLRRDDNNAGLILLKTTDGGDSWTIIYADTSFKSNDSVYYPKYWGVKCEYYDDGKIIILTSNGKFILSNDFGETFEEIQINNYFQQSFIMLDSENALTTSSVWADLPNTEYQILKSTDGCKSWEDFPVPDSISQRWRLTTLMLQKDNSVIIRCIAKYGLESDTTKNYFYHTDFDGNFWKYLELTKYINYIYLFDDNEGFATGKIVVPGPFNDTAVTSKTYDGGKTWEFKSKTTYPNESFSSHIIHKNSILFIAGSGFGFLKSTDKGESWYKPTLVYGDEIDANVLHSGVESYFDIGTIYLTTIVKSQVLKGTRIGTSVHSPSVKPKKIFPNPVTYGSDFIAEYEIATPGHLKMYLSDLSGREVCPLYSDFAESGSYSTSLRLPENISSGSYWLVSEQNGYKHVQLLNVVK
jgi:photosystem II stability/assembly factor-like uncharacterized protein